MAFTRNSFCVFLLQKVSTKERFLLPYFCFVHLATANASMFAILFTLLNFFYSWVFKTSTPLLPWHSIHSKSILATINNGVSIFNFHLNNFPECFFVNNFLVISSFAYNDTSNSVHCTLYTEWICWIFDVGWWSLRYFHWIVWSANIQFMRKAK